MERGKWKLLVGLALAIELGDFLLVLKDVEVSLTFVQIKNEKL